MTVLEQEPHPPTLGTIQAMSRLDEQAEGKKGMALVLARLRALNFRYCWTPGLRNKAGTNWGQVNQHLWRIAALYQGGDCFLAGWPNAIPHQKLYPTQALIGKSLCDWKQVRRCRNGLFTIIGYRTPR